MLFGVVNPSGKLPYTIAKRPEDYGAQVVSGTTVDYSEGYGVT